MTYALFWKVLLVLGIDQLAVFLVLKVRPDLISPYPHFLAEFPFSLTSLTALSILIILGLILRGKVYYSWPYSLVVAGSLSNTLVYLREGYFVDYLNWGISSANLADFFIMAGIVWIFGLYLKENQQKISPD